eukprot:365114-Chlamydomonas_euryale.AAC.5
MDGQNNAVHAQGWANVQRMHAGGPNVQRMQKDGPTMQRRRMDGPKSAAHAHELTGHAVGPPAAHGIGRRHEAILYLLVAILRQPQRLPRKYRYLLVAILHQPQRLPRKYRYLLVAILRQPQRLPRKYRYLLVAILRQPQRLPRKYRYLIVAILRQPQRLPRKYRYLIVAILRQPQRPPSRHSGVPACANASTTQSLTTSAAGARSMALSARPSGVSQRGTCCAQSRRQSQCPAGCRLQGRSEVPVLFGGGQEGCVRVFV